MDVMTLREVMEKCEADFDETLRRFAGNEALLDRFVRKFPGDPTFEELKEAMTQEDLDAAERLVHTLKGTSANLGFQKLSLLCSAMLGELRQAGIDQAKTEFLAVTEEYERTVQAIGSIEQL